MAGETKSFGTCCEMLKEAMSGAEFTPLISVGDDGVLYMAIGMVDEEEEEPGMVEFPLYHCPFCGSELQTPEEVDARSAASSATVGASGKAN
jgi:hypothetical protein